MWKYKKLCARLIYACFVRCCLKKCAALCMMQRMNMCLKTIPFHIACCEDPGLAHRSSSSCGEIRGCWNSAALCNLCKWCEGTDNAQRDGNTLWIKWIFHHQVQLELTVFTLSTICKQCKFQSKVSRYWIGKAMEPSRVTRFFTPFAWKEHEA